MFTGRWIAPDADASDAAAIRAAAGLGGADALDAACWHALIADETGRDVATGRVWWADGAFWLGGVCVLPDCRGRGWGDLVARMLLFKALSHGARELRACAPDAAGRAFAARYGFQPDAAGALTLNAADASLCCGGEGRG